MYHSKKKLLLFINVGAIISAQGTRRGCSCGNADGASCESISLCTCPATPVAQARRILVPVVKTEKHVNYYCCSTCCHLSASSVGFDRVHPLPPSELRVQQLVFLFLPKYMITFTSARLQACELSVTRKPPPSELVSQQLIFFRFVCTHTCICTCPKCVSARAAGVRAP